MLDEGKRDRIAGGRDEALHLVSIGALAGLRPGQIASLEVIDRFVTGFPELGGGFGAAAAAPAVNRYGRTFGHQCPDAGEEIVGIPVGVQCPVQMPFGILFGGTDIHQADFAGGN